jgi:hypothetical protein
MTGDMFLERHFILGCRIVDALLERIGAQGATCEHIGRKVLSLFFHMLSPFFNSAERSLRSRAVLKEADVRLQIASHMFTRYCSSQNLLTE